MRMVSKGTLMKLTKNCEGVDSALPEPWLEQVTRLGFDRHEILYSYGYSYKDNSWGRPISLPVAFLELLENTPLECHDQQGEIIETYNGKPSLMDFVMSILDSSDKWKIQLR